MPTTKLNSFYTLSNSHVTFSGEEDGSSPKVPKLLFKSSEALIISLSFGSFKSCLKKSKPLNRRLPEISQQKFLLFAKTLRFNLINLINDRLLNLSMKDFLIRNTYSKTLKTQWHKN